MLASGVVVGGRFRVSRVAGAGGMGTVYQALDLGEGEKLVALKTMDGVDLDGQRRFGREASILAALRDPRIVRYLDHGAHEGVPYLAMEWVEGMDLARRLLKGPMTLGETVALGVGMAQALAAGVVHRDVKPSNILLRQGSAQAPCLVDFGVARLAGRRSLLTGTGVAIGTPYYMAPEQAGATREVTGKADVFALACVLHECLSGSPAFAAESLAAVLARILFSAPNSLPLAPARDEIDRLLAEMFEKDPAKRPTAEDVAARLAGAPISSTATVGRPIGDVELRLASLWFARSAPVKLAATIPALATDEEGTPGLGSGVDVLSLADGTLVGSASFDRPHDQARAVVGSALRFKADAPGASLVVTTGRATTRGLLPTDEAIARATAMLDRGHGDSGLVRLDDATAELVAAHFPVRRDDVSAYVPLDVGPGEAPDGAWEKLVGRSKELGFIRAACEESVEERVFRAVVVTGPPGIGKSHLLQEFVRGVRGRGVAVIGAASEPTEAAAPLSFVGHLLRAAPDADAAPPGTNSPPPDEELFLVREAVRQAATTRGDGDLQHAAALSFARWLTAESAAQPLVLAIEDLQWVDGSSLGAIRRVGGGAAPIFLLAVAREPLREDHRQVLDSLRATAIRLEPLSPRAAEQLVRARAPGLQDDVVATIVQRSGGNPLFLDELARAATRTGGWDARTSLEATVEARILSLPPEARRVLRAASIFGVRFSAEGVEDLLLNPPDIAGSLASLQEEGLVEALDEGTFSFRHEIFHRAVYAMVPSDDRQRAHRHVALWLEAGGWAEPAVLAHHWLLGAGNDEEAENAAARVMAVVRIATVRDGTRWLDSLAERTARMTGATAPALRVRLLESRARLLARSDRALAHQAGVEWLEAAREAQDTPGVARALANLAANLAGRGEVKRARELLVEATTLADGVESEEVRFAVGRSASLVEYLDGDQEMALLTGRREAERTSGRFAAVWYHNAADAALRLSRFDEALALLDESDAAMATLPRGAFGPHNGVLRIFVQVFRGRAEWRRELDAALLDAEASEEVWVSLEIRLFMGVLEAWFGQPERGRAVFLDLERRALAASHIQLAGEAKFCEAAIGGPVPPWFRGGVRPTLGERP